MRFVKQKSTRQHHGQESNYPHLQIRRQIPSLKNSFEDIYNHLIMTALQTFNIFIRNILFYRNFHVFMLFCSNILVLSV